MQTYKAKTVGLTIIELMLIIVASFVLVTLIWLGISGVQASGRDRERQDDIIAMQRALESYYAQTNSYPALTDINNPRWRKNNMPKMASTAMSDPKWSQNETNCTDAKYPTLAPTSKANCYSYLLDSGHYTLTATLESGETFTKTSLN